MQEDQFQAQPTSDIGFPPPPPPKAKSGMLKWLVLVVGLVAILGLGGWFLFRNSSSSDEPTPTPDTAGLSTFNSPEETEPEVTQTPTPTPKVVNKSEIKIKVLNGTGVPGEASFLQKELQKIGYTEVEAGNADSQNETLTTVTFSKNISDTTVSELTKLLEGIFTEVKTKTGTVSGVDIQIVTGPRKGKPVATKSPSPTTSASPKASPSASPTVSPSPTTQ